VDSLDRATAWLLGKAEKEPQAVLAGATPYLRLFGNAAGGCMLAHEGLAALPPDNGEGASRNALSRFLVEKISVPATGLERAVIDGAESVNAADAALTA